ncbi:coiled-coil domain-containing protein 66-like isoform X2 [Glandiceps talaboti]
MNIGEGLRIAALAKKGSAGVFIIGDPEPKKKKKFSYLRKTQQHSLRKPESEPVVDLPPKPAKRTNISRATTHHAESRNQGVEQDENVDEEKKKPAVDFVRRNALAAKKAKDSKGSKKAAVRQQKDNSKDTNTVTLTKEQLNAILSAIGTSAQLEAALAPTGLAKENKTPSREKSTVEKSKTPSEDKKDEGVDKEDDKIHDTVKKTEDKKEEVPVRQIATNQDSAANKDDFGAGLGNIGGIIGTSGYNDKSLAERKKQQWKRELDEQVARQKKDKELQKSVDIAQEKELQKSFDAWHPFGRGGGGAPNVNYSMTTTPHKVITQQTQPITTTQSPPDRGAPSRIQFSQAKVPAAMRTSFVLGDASPWERDHSSVKRQEKQEWLAELEKQRQEVRERKEREKHAHQSEFKETWADQLETMRGQPQNPRYQSRDPLHTVDDVVVTSTRHQEPELNLQKDVEIQPKSAPQTALPPEDYGAASAANPNNARSERSYARGFGHQSLMDPNERDRLEKERLKQKEHQEGIRAQVEEKLRLKREAEDKKKREEMEEERRLALERDDLQQQFDKEQRKQREKEEDLDRKTKALMHSMQVAQEQAAQEKHARRIRHLMEGGHDIKHLQKSWEVHHSPENTPRGAVFSQEKFTPRSGVVDPATIASPVYGESVPLSPVKEQAIQTETEIPEPNVLPPNLLRIAREESAGIEYRGVPKSKQKPKKTTRDDRGRSRLREEKVKQIRRSPSPEEVTEKKRYKKLSERPGWGQPNPNKKKAKKASDKDLTLDRRRKEERLRKRQEELLLQQELNAPERLLPRHRSVSPPIPAVRSRLRTVSPDNRSSRRATYDSPDGRQTRHRSYSPAGRTTKQHSHYGSPPPDMPSSPPLKTGDFAPFVRSEVNELNADSVPQTPVKTKKPHKQRQRRHSIESLEDRTEKKKERKTEQEMDPLLNPDRLKDSEHRQEMILKQLSHLRQGLIMKQRELEVGLTPYIN